MSFAPWSPTCVLSGPIGGITALPPNPVLKSASPKKPWMSYWYMQGFSCGGGGLGRSSTKKCFFQNLKIFTFLEIMAQNQQNLEFRKFLMPNVSVGLSLHIKTVWHIESYASKLQNRKEKNMSKLRPAGK